MLANVRMPWKPNSEISNTQAATKDTIRVKQIPPARQTHVEGSVQS
jgi:hypothetical protein